MALEPADVVARCRAVWDADIQPALEAYIAVPAVSVAFDPDWEASGHLDAVVEAAAAWARARPIEGLQVEVVRIPGRTPVLWFEVAATDPGADPADTALLYGHLDKQPPMHGWRDGLGPWTPVVDGDRLYGRGGADDGYAAYASLAAIEAVQAGGGAHRRCVGLIECSEESGSPDLPAYVDLLADRIGTPSLVACLDSFAGDYDRLWTTTSLRGLLSVTLTVEVLTEGVHSGSASGVVPDSFRIARHLLDRVEDPDTGRVRGGAHVVVPLRRRSRARRAGRGPRRPADGQDLGAHAHGDRRRRPAVGGQRGQRPAALHDPRPVVPPAAVGRCRDRRSRRGSRAGGGPAARRSGDGVGHERRERLGRPGAQFLLTGVLGPGSNAHGPNEFLHLPTGRAVTAVVAMVLDAHARRTT